MLFGIGYMFIFIGVSLLTSLVVAMIKARYDYIGFALGLCFIIGVSVGTFILVNAGNVIENYKYSYNKIYHGETRYYLVFNEYERAGNCVTIKAPYYETHNYAWELGYTAWQRLSGQSTRVRRIYGNN